MKKNLIDTWLTSFYMCKVADLEVAASVFGRSSIWSNQDLQLSNLLYIAMLALFKSVVLK